MKITKKTEYAIRCLIDMSVHEEDAPLSVETISNRQEISIKFLSAILTDLKKFGFVRSKKGPNGGFSLAKSLHNITFQQIVKSMDGVDPYEILFSEIKNNNAANTQQVLKDAVDEINQATLRTMRKLTLLELKTRYLKISQGDDNYSI